MIMAQNQNKIRSKLLRMKMSEEIKKIIKISGIKNLQETQVGNFIYRASGSVQLGSFMYDVILSVKLVKEEPEVNISLPQIGMSASSSMDPKEFKEKSKKLFRSVLN